MSDRDPIFVPGLFGRTGIVPTVVLKTPLYVIHGTFTHPVSGADTKLPAHQFVLFDPAAGTIVAASAPSDANGICVVDAMGDLGNGGFVLGLVPAPADVRKYYLDNDEAWIDLDTSDWASPQPDRTKIERRNLYRIPAWTSLRKATRGGGFKEWPDKVDPRSKERGFLLRDDIIGKPFGSMGKPWEIPIDFGWVLATFRFSYVDWAHDKMDVLPPGLFVDVVPAQAGGAIKRMGGGTAVKDGDGSTRMMIEADPTRWAGFMVQFRAPPLARVDLKAAPPAAGAKDTRLVAGGTLPADRTEYNRLPVDWHSLGHRCKATVKTPAKTLSRDSWVNIAAQLQKDKAADVTVDFHLDDVQLCNGDRKPRTNVNGRPALFDHFLTLMDPVATRPHQSDTTVDKSVLTADKVYPLGRPKRPGQTRLMLTTRLIGIEGDLFDLRDDRVTGTIGETPGLGARAAFHNFHPNKSFKSGGNPAMGGSGFYEIHLVDVPGVNDPTSGKQLMHMLLHVSCKVDPGKLTPPQIDSFWQMLTQASQRWSQGSPGVPAPVKNYQIVTKDPASRDHVIRPRAYFGEKSSSAVLDISLKSGSDRPETIEGYCFGALGRNMNYYESNLNEDVAGSGGGASDSDGFFAVWHHLAHEFGHVLGLPDEYPEELDPASVDPMARVRNPRVPRFKQMKEDATDYRPYYGDRYSQMNQDTLPRLRHYWHHVKALNDAANFAAGLPKRPYVLRHDSLALEYVRPLDANVSPYTPVFFDKPLSVGFAQCALFPLGDDEGSVEVMFAAPGAVPVPLPPAARFDGILIVRSRVHFRFDSTVAKVRRWQMIFDFQNRLYDSDHRLNMGMRFALVGGTKLKHIAVSFQPLFDEGFNLSTDDFKMVFTNKIPVGPNPFDGTVGSSVDLDIAHFNVNTVMRAILGMPTSFTPVPGKPAVANVTPLNPVDLTNVVKLVDAELADTAGSPRMVVVM